MSTSEAAASGLLLDEDWTGVGVTEEADSSAGVACAELPSAYIQCMKRYVPILLTTILSLSLVGCGGPLKYEVTSSAQAPGADAKIIARVETEQHSTELDIEVSNLAPPVRVAPGSTAFVVWQRRDSSVAWSRVGALAYDEKSRAGSFSGTVPEVAFNLIICAEQRLDVVTPSTDIVFSQRIEKE